MSKPAKLEQSAASPHRDPGPYVVTDAREFLMIMTDDAQLAAIVGGARLPIAERAWRRAYPGETVTDLPRKSVAGLLADGLIRRPAPEAEAAKLDAAHAEALKMDAALAKSTKEAS